MISSQGVIPTELSNDLDVIFADLLAEGKFGLVEASVSQPHNFASTVYASPTCLLRFKSNDRMGFEWGAEIAPLPKNNEKPRWDFIEGICIFLRKESPQETFERLLQVYKKCNSQISLQEYADSIRPLNTQIIRFFDLEDFEERWKGYKEHDKWHTAELSRLSAEHYGYSYTPASEEE